MLAMVQLSSSHAPDSPVAEFDYVIVGAGSSGAALAARLVEQMQCTVLLLEAGGEDRSIWIHVPLGVGKIFTNPRYVWSYNTVDEPGLNSRSIFWTKGRVLGGSSSVNGMIFARGDAATYDRWAELGCPGWSYRDVLPWFRKLENRVGEASELRGRGGPITVSDVAYESPLAEAFIEACQAEGIPLNADYNGARYEGVSRLQMSIRNGRRVSTRVAYLTPLKRNPNLKVLTHAMVEQVVLRGRQCKGVVFRYRGKAREVSARREVILAAGSIETPAILERSGIGNPAHLQVLGIKTNIALPSIGENLQDHLQVRMTYECRNAVTVNQLLHNPIHGALAVLHYLATRRGFLATPSTFTHAIVKSDPTMDLPDIKLQLSLISGADRFSLTRGLGVDRFSGMTIGSFQLHPESRGSVHITSAEVEAPLTICANYLSTETDQLSALDGLKTIRRIMSSPAFKPFIVREVLPSAELRSDSELLNYARATAQTCWHPVGTCRMGSDPAAVVDPQLRVRGVSNLRIADLSVLPLLVSCNTNAPAIMIGERAADLIRNEDKNMRMLTRASAGDVR